MSDIHDPYEAPKSDFEEPPKSTNYVMDGPQGLVGFLLLPLLGMLVTVMSFFYTLLNVYFPMIGADFWQIIYGGALLFQSMNLFNLSFLIFGVLFNLVLLWCFFCKLRIFPKLIQCWYVAAVLYNFIYLVMVIVARESYPEIFIEGSFATAVFQSLVVAMLWIPYFRVSKRVKNTFQN